MFNQFVKYEDAFRDWRDGTLWPHHWESFLRVV